VLAVEEEKVALMERKRKEQEEAKRKQDELEKILAENRRKVSVGKAACALSNVRAEQAQGLCKLEAEGFKEWRL